ncbi:hypothetical protein BH18ACI1_BH18ACI1_16550 [soil metagenome]
MTFPSRPRLKAVTLNSESYTGKIDAAVYRDGVWCLLQSTNGFTLNFRERRINFADIGDNQFEPAVRLPFETNDGQILLNLKIKQTNLKFVFDSGAANLTRVRFGLSKTRKANRTERTNDASFDQRGQNSDVDRLVG